MVPFDFPSKYQGAWGKLCFHLRPWDRARSSITWPQHHSFLSFSPTVFQKRQLFDSCLSTDNLERRARQGTSTILQQRAIPMVVISSSSIAVLLLESTLTLSRFGPNSLLFLSAVDIYFFIAHGTVMTLQQSSPLNRGLKQMQIWLNIIVRKSYSCDCGQKLLCKCFYFFRNV